ncbi:MULTISPECIES: DUF6879 family protein [Pseudonocardia]|uniref:DUF6879 family protein n=1 Tax=Pseudonocardia alni subsp. carboxydivorans TaxID=415010 RepID=A0ABU9AL15_PSEA5|nr:MULTISPECIES: DUF6879 family protein [unclassified Pseudonocardia]ANY10815.1 hypothetical protein AFB00_30955 [Pseudonocardia sp. HH130630-07]
MIDEQQLEAAIDKHFHHAGDRLFRMECLPRYMASEGEESDFQRYLAGADGPDMERKEQWLAILRGEEARGLISYRVRAFSNAMTEYERYEADWCYVHNAAAGEDISVLRAGEHDTPATFIREDFWLVNDALLIPMQYDEHGRFLSADIVTDPDLIAPYLRARDDAHSAAEPFRVWWDRHPELHHRQRAA